MACPDLGEPQPDGLQMPIEGTDIEFPDCPSYYLRRVDDGLPADHLIDGAQHPADVVLPLADELEHGAVRIAELPPKVARLVRIARSERAKAEAHAMDEARKRTRS